MTKNEKELFDALQAALPCVQFVLARNPGNELTYKIFNQMQEAIDNALAREERSINEETGSIGWSIANERSMESDRQVREGQCSQQA